MSNRNPIGLPLWNVLLALGVSKEGIEYKVSKEIENALSRLIGFASHGGQAIFQQNLIPQLRNIDTALQSFSSLFTADIAALLPGSVFSLGQLGNLLTDAMKKEIFDAIPKDVGQALNTLLNNIKSTEGDINGKRVNLPVFLANVVAELKESKTVEELIEKFIKIMDDESLSGMDLLDNVETIISGGFGDITLNIDALGNITETLSDAASQALSLFSSSLGGLPAVNGSLFDQVENLAGMIGRRPREDVEKIRKNFEEFSKAPK